MYLPYFGQNLDSNKNAVRILAHARPVAIPVIIIPCHYAIRREHFRTPMENCIPSWGVSKHFSWSGCERLTIITWKKQAMDGAALFSLLFANSTKRIPVEGTYLFSVA